MHIRSRRQDLTRSGLTHLLVTLAGKGLLTVSYRVINGGDLPIMLGEAYELERASRDGWEPVELPYVLRLWGRRLESRDRDSLRLVFPTSLRLVATACASVWLLIAIHIPGTSGWRAGRSKRSR